MQENFSLSLKLVLAHEGGFVDHPKDPGGATNFGVTQKVYDAFRKRRGDGGRSVRKITMSEVEAIYRAQYWAAVRGDDLPLGLDYVVFDYGVNSGPKRAVQTLQAALGVKVDGAIGEVTLAAIERADMADLIEDICERRMAFLKRLKTWKTFGRGWSRRVMGQHDGAQDDDTGVIDRALAMRIGDVVTTPVASVPGRAVEEERTSPIQSGTIQAVAAQFATVGAGTVAGVSALDGAAQIAVIVAAGAVLLLGLWILRERLALWAEGVR
jgi:lysozyme family protein